MGGQADLNNTASANRLHIGFFGCRNAGKSSVVNAVTGQDLAVVSDVLGTTTDPVMKSMELLPLGPVVVIDTPGFDDEGMLGSLRVRKTRQILNRTDVAVLVVDGTAGIRSEDEELLGLFREKQIPHLIALNKSDLAARPHERWYTPAGAGDKRVRQISVSARTGEGINELKEQIGKMAPAEDPAHTVTGELVSGGQTAVLVCPIDKAAPKGRLIMPQQMTIRSILDSGGAAMITRESELQSTLSALKEDPAIVITDSQVFDAVSRIVPERVPLTSFSILMAKYKGFLETSVRAVAAIRTLKDGDRILMAEGCTHHRQCGDIGTVKIPAWLRKYSGADLTIETSSGRDFPEDLQPYAAVIHCGGCMITERDVRYRMKCAKDQGVPFSNYGIVIAQMSGILERSLRIFPEIHAMLEHGGADERMGET